MKKLLLLTLFLPFGSCIFHPAGTSKVHEGPFIDSIGYKALQSRLETIDQEASTSLISQALSVQDDTLQTVPQSTFFQSLEESYQRYLKLFAPVKRAPRPEIRCGYDLVETFKLLLFDPQPFINAMLHTMSLAEVSTLDFRVEPKNEDTTFIYVALTKTVHQEGTNGVTISEGDLILSVAGRRAALMTPIP
jgi:hypothetical protein